MTKQDIEKRTKALIKILKFFDSIKSPIYTPEECPLKKHGNHYELSIVTGGRGAWQWHCPLCGKQDSE